MNALDVGALVDTIRRSLAVDERWQMMNLLPPPYNGPPLLNEAPADYLEWLAISDGFVCGPIVMFDAKTVPSMQFYADTPADAPVRLSQDQWFCAGVVSDEPWFIKRSDGSIWIFPDTGVAWWMGGRFEQVAPSLERFFLDIICGPAYLTLTGASEGDQWWQLLGRIGRI